MSKATVVMHGYSQNVPPGGRPWEAVVDDRLSRTLEVAEFFQRHGIDTEVLLGVGHETEECSLREYAQKRFPGLNDFGARFVGSARNTAAEVTKTYPIARANGGIVLPVSSVDHIPRVAREWNYAIQDGEMLVAPVASKERYSEKDGQPIIWEPPFWAYKIGERIPELPADKRASFVSEVERLLKEAGV